MCYTNTTCGSTAAIGLTKIMKFYFNKNKICNKIIFQAEGRSAENWHGHVTAVTVGPEHRRLGLAADLMTRLEQVSEQKRAFFVDLFVRKSNEVS